MEWIVLGLFCAGLIVCVAADLSVLYALLFGLFLFLGYAAKKGAGPKELFSMTMEGILEVRKILLTFLLIGVMTGLWRASGTIPYIVSRASVLIRPQIYLLMTFLLNCGVSVLTGTSFGTSATMGVICAAMGAAMGVDVRLTGGAVLSGAMFGDRCSPVSTSALLVSEVTGTNIFDNIKNMIRTAVVPFILTCLLYGAAGFFTGSRADLPDLSALFGREFALRWPALLPAAVLLVLSVMRVPVRPAMTASVLTAVPVCLLLQKAGAADILRAAVFGYKAADPALSAMVDGGGVLSMLRTTGIVCLSSSYAGIFKKTGLLSGAQRIFERAAARTNAFTGIFLAACASSAIACNQTLSILLTGQLAGSLRKEKEQRALDLEDTAVVISPLVPWSIAGAVPLAAAGAPPSAVVYACYLYILPLWRLVTSFWEKKKE